MGQCVDEHLEAYELLTPVYIRDNDSSAQTPICNFPNL